ncbi:MarR family winged helix-turn-helix transcriptional regulator [Geodermatophilus sp. CPCC 206100]|uniref:MarR family winged helix-turn-helix transcriptional regulator n=1 Tax=Geodermatophilus sp. CPCC 206100 TaxID=3020054 RepID=UPI003B00CB87
MSTVVNDRAELPVSMLFEVAMRRVRDELYALSDDRYPGLRSRHYRLLALLPAEGERVSRLTEDSGLTKQALAQALAPLEAGGFVEVLPDPTDRRARLVRLSPLGREANQAVRDRLGDVEREWASRVGPDRWAQARAVLADLALAGPPGRAD